MKILTEFKTEVIEYNRRFPSVRNSHKTEVIVIADSLQSAIDRALEITPKKHLFDIDYVMEVKVISARDILVDSEVANED